MLLSMILSIKTYELRVKLYIPLELDFEWVIGLANFQTHNSVSTIEENLMGEASGRCDGAAWRSITYLPLDSVYRLAKAFTVQVSTSSDVVSLLASHQGEPGLIPDQIFACGNRFGRCRRFSRGSPVSQAASFRHCAKFPPLYPRRL
ncbi:hypothetical protein PR048_027141 [Dryococelus australis]|uniref:Uncharacterized protein n=1 Tax=Dryococelus australis TaxID=614101 RepID=A0ABQ9GEL8_9NEOP|nr:hypothetical protein PR048_027141 [Dryococelus australis]